MIPIDSSASALQALQKAQANSAHNVANANTPNFLSTQAVFHSTESGNVKLELKQQREQDSEENETDEDLPSDTDLAQETANTITYKRSFEANVKVIRAQDEMLGSLLDILS